MYNKINMSSNVLEKDTIQMVVSEGAIFGNLVMHG